MKQELKQVNFFVMKSIPSNVESVLGYSFAKMWPASQIQEAIAHMGYIVSIKQIEAYGVLLNEQERMDSN